ncbi:Arm DNA-binding domain-containing protein [Streptococcus anginosus]|nr:Arm DNA-binding domain-containing protein [Streptococcus anginosus]
MASYRKRNNGWEYRVSYKKPDGTYGEKSKRGYRTKSEAERAAAEAQRELAEAVEIDRKVELADYFKKWAEIHKKPHVSIGTWKSYQQAVRIVTEYFQHTKLTAVTSTAYQQFLNNLGERYTKNTIRQIHHKIRTSC